MSRHLFGTDGIRGRAGLEPLTSDTMESFGFTLSAQLGGTGAAVIIGHDGRESGETLVAALAKGLSRGGVAVHVVGLAPTPAVAYLTMAGDYAAGIMVSASHNPASDNGVKLFGADGSKLNDEREAAIEAAFNSEDQAKAAETPGAIRRTKNLLADYIGWLRADAFPDLDLGGRRILIDCANGAVSQIASRVVHAFGGEPFTVFDKPDGRNINDGCGAMHPEVAAAATIEHECWIGLSVDGDGDRAMLIDGKGRILDGDGILAGLGELLGARDALHGKTVVATVMSNLALEQWIESRDLHLERTQVGDRYVADAMRAKNFTLGGEKSGHMLFGAEHGFRGDGLYTLLKVCNELRSVHRNPEDFAANYADLPQRLLNLDAVRRAPMEELPHLVAACAAVDAQLAGDGRTVVRFSGTELKLRLMVEARTEQQVEEALEVLRAAAEADEILAS